MKRSSLQVSIELILKTHGKLKEFESSQCFHLRLEKPNYDPLVIERHGNRAMVAHYYVQNGDLMADPEIEFDISTAPITGGLWFPVALTQAPVGIYRAKFFRRNGKDYVDMNFDRDVRPLANLWAKNLRFQEWEKATSTPPINEQLVTQGAPRGP